MEFSFKIKERKKKKTAVCDKDTFGKFAELGGSLPKLFISNLARESGLNTCVLAQ